MSSRKAYMALGMATFAFAISFAVWSLLAPLATQLQALYHIGDLEISVLIAIPVLLGSLMRIPLGVLTDRFGGRRVMTILLGFVLLPCLGMMTASSFAAFAFWGFLLGMAGTSFAVGVPFVSRWFPASKQGLALGIFGMGNIGTAISARFAPLIANSAGGWQWVFFYFALGVLITAVAFYFLAKDEPQATTTKTIGERLSLLKGEKIVWILCLFYFVTFGGFVAFGLYLPKLLVDVYALDKIDAGNRTAIFVLLATLARPLGGWLSDTFSASKLLLLVFGTVALMAFLLALQPGMILLTISFLIMAVALGAGNGAVFKLVPHYYAREAGTVTGLVGAAGGLGGFFPPLIMGFSQSTWQSYTPGYLLLTCTALICLGFVVLLLISREKTRIRSSKEHFSLKENQP